MPAWRRFFETLILRLLLLLAATQTSLAAPGIIITNLPAYGSNNDLKGVAVNANPATQAVAVLIYVPGYGWVTKPTCAQPLTPIQPDGSWSADITTGGGDPNATRVAALLVGTNYNLPCVLGTAFLSTNIYAQALASSVATRPSAGVRFISFSGYDWWVKTSVGQVGPGPNYFSDSTNNVWVDAQGALHLRITNRSNQWQCAEIVSARTFGYGDYRFELNSAVDYLDRNVVLGLFTWSDDPVFAFREIDVEASRWSNAADTNNAQYVVQPFNLAGHLVRYRVPPSVTNSTHYFHWQTNQISHGSQRGQYYPNPNPTNIISSWNYAQTIPLTGDENVRLNLWLYQGNPPADNQEEEVVIKGFQFLPLGAPKSAVFKDPSLTSGNRPQFQLVTEFDRRYLLQVSTNLNDWSDMATMLATNVNMIFTDAEPIASGRRFYRAITLP